MHFLEDHQRDTLQAAPVISKHQNIKQAEVHHIHMFHPEINKDVLLYIHFTQSSNQKQKLTTQEQ